MTEESPASAQPTWYATVLRPADPGAAGREPTQAEADLLNRQDAWVGALHADGRVALSGRAASKDDSFGVVVFAADDEIAAASSASQMPGVAAGLLASETAPFDVMLRAPMAPGMTYAYRLLPTRADILLTGPTERETELMMAHWGYCEQLHADGRLVFAGRSGRPDDPYALIVLTGVDQSDAEEILTAEPGVAGGLFSVTLFPFEVVLAAADVTAAAG